MTFGESEEEKKSDDELDELTAKLQALEIRKPQTEQNAQTNSESSWVVLSDGSGSRINNSRP